ncbi:hypothetical protein ACIQOW_08325 [Kitasatospora sp. NPDC091335]|uniref:hypothetical protein n=1 Tax=Kitasatospora sp. NPDC091335 TaxID=3364085 RepID=UPI003819A22A
MPARSRLTIRIGAAAAALAAGLVVLVGATSASTPASPAADSSWGVQPGGPTPTSSPIPTVATVALADDSSWG